MTFTPPPDSYGKPAGEPGYPGQVPPQPPLGVEPPSSNPAAQPAAAVDAHGRIERRRVSAVWIGVIIAAVLLIALVIFIAQNSRTAKIDFLWFHGHFAIALALLLAGVTGALLVAVPGTVRIIQLRKALKVAARTSPTPPNRALWRSHQPRAHSRQS